MRSESKCIAFYVGFTTTLSNWIDPVTPFLHRLGFRIIVLHIDSLNFGFRTGMQPIERAYETYDIASAGLKGLIHFMKEQNISTIFMLAGLRSLMELLLIRSARMLGIKTVYLQHGLHTDDVTKFAILKMKTALVRRLPRVARHLYTLGMFLGFAAFHAQGTMKELKALRSFYLNKDNDQRRYDYALVYAHHYAEFMKSYFGYNDDQIFYSGYPVTQSEEDLLKVSHPFRSKGRKRVLFLHSNFISSGLTDITHEEERDYFHRIASMCRSFDYDLVIRIHPRDSLDEYRRHFQDISLDVQQSGDLLELVKDFDLIISQYSTALFSCILLNKPIVFMYYPGANMSSLVFKDIAFTANRDEELLLILESPNTWSGNLGKYNDFIHDFIGTGNSFEHQVMVMESIVCGAKSSLSCHARRSA